MLNRYGVKWKDVRSTHALTGNLPVLPAPVIFVNKDQFKNVILVIIKKVKVLSKITNYNFFELILNVEKCVVRTYVRMSVYIGFPDRQFKIFAQI